jgi:hypothetical protein
MFGLRLIGAVLIIGSGADLLERLRFSAPPQTRQTEDLLPERHRLRMDIPYFMALPEKRCGEQTRKGKRPLALE